MHQSDQAVQYKQRIKKLYEQLQIAVEAVYRECEDLLDEEVSTELLSDI